MSLAGGGVSITHKNINETGVSLQYAQSNVRMLVITQVCYDVAAIVLYDTHIL